MNDIQNRKDLIRERYQGTDYDKLEVLPARPPESIYDSSAVKRVAVYVRVSTDSLSQTSSYELQKNHYTDLVNQRPGWQLEELYADEGISGTSLNHRDAFLRMIEDCHLGKIDIILTKSVSRFARNIIDCIGYVRQLKALSPPVGIKFEAENIFTLDDNSEMALSFMAAMAQEESHNKSDIMNASLEMRFRRGIFLTPALLGYDKDEKGQLVVNEAEAKIVRFIFYRYLSGSSCREIADQLTQMGQTTKKGNAVWNPRSILEILQNERHCGDVLARKTWTPNYLDHKSRKNRQDRNQYRQNNHHRAIISKEDFIAVQKLIFNARFKGKGILPELRVIPSGALKGFVSVHPRWAGFKARDYQDACLSVLPEGACTKTRPTEVFPGDFDLRGYEVARAQFFAPTRQPYLLFTPNSIRCNQFSLQKLRNICSVEFLLHPIHRLLAVRPCKEDCSSRITWAREKDGQAIPRKIHGAAFLPVLYELCGWNPRCKYRCLGTLWKKGSEQVLIISLRETEIFLPSGLLPEHFAEPEAPQNPEDTKDCPPGGQNPGLLAYPRDWYSSFGNSFYYQAQADELAAFRHSKDWQLQAPGIPFRAGQQNVTSPAEAQKNAAELVKEFTNHRTDHCTNQHTDHYANHHTDHCANQHTDHCANHRTDHCANQHTNRSPANY